MNATVLVAPCAYNEIPKIARVLDRLDGVPGIDVVVVDDGSTDGTTQLIRSRNQATVRHQHRSGAGACVRSAIHYFLDRDYEILVMLAGNDKDRPAEILRLIEPILGNECDLVQGSRYLPGGYAGNTPFYRRVATRYVHPWLFSGVIGQRMTDTTNGFRAIHRRVLQDSRMNLEARWLDGYELEPYLLYKAVKLGYRVGEVPVTKVYPPKAVGYTKMKPVTGWWSILRPIFLLGLGIKN
ncbi:MAG: glycosyltransferase family 2 protein [Phycisphaerae bacterium]